MPHSEAQAWWADVQHVRESIERRRAGGLDSAAPLDASAERRFSRRASESLPPLDDLDWNPGAVGQPTGRFDRNRSQRGEHAAPRARRATADRRTRADRPGGESPDRVELSPEWGDTTATAGIPADGAATATALSPPPRRTVQITGRTVSAPPLPRLVEVERRRPARRTVERVGPRPDRIALWAVLLGFFLILVAATSSNAAVPSAHATHANAVALHSPAR
jgi:hypothetical protein